MVILAAFVMAATLPGRTHGLGFITKPMLEEIDLSKGAYSWMNFAATLIGAAFCIPCGWIIDRGGLRWLVGGTVAALGCVVYAMAQVSDPTQLAILVTLTRGLGQSMLSVISITMVARWFQRRLGPAMGIFSVIMSVLMMIVSITLLHFVGTVGWRTAWGTQGWILIASAPILALLTFSAPRDRSIEFSEPLLDKTQAAESQNTLLDALCSPSFWVFSLAISLFGLLSSGLSLFQEYILNERDFGREAYQLLMFSGMMVGMVTNLVAGWMANRYDLRRMLAFALLAYATALAGFPFVYETWHIVVYALVQGVGGGTLTVLFFAVWGKYFPGAHLGRIQGAAQMMTVFASALGPVMVEWSHSQTGSYLQVFTVAAVTSALLAVCALLTPLPRHLAERESLKLAHS